MILYKPFQLSHLIAKAIRELPPFEQLAARTALSLEIPIQIRDSIDWESPPYTDVWGIGTSWISGEVTTITGSTGNRYEVILDGMKFMDVVYRDSVKWTDIESLTVDPPMYASRVTELIGGHQNVVSAVELYDYALMLVTDHRVITWKSGPGLVPSDDELMSCITTYSDADTAKSMYDAVIGNIASRHG
jgi:hypothetical protein